MKRKIVSFESLGCTCTRIYLGTKAETVAASSYRFSVANNSDFIDESNTFCTVSILLHQDQYKKSFFFEDTQKMEQDSLAGTKHTQMSPAVNLNSAQKSQVLVIHPPLHAPSSHHPIPPKN